MSFLKVPDDITTSSGTILHYFCAISYVEGVQTLLQEPFKCDPNVQNKNKFSPILIAAKENNFDIVNVLLEFQADPNSQYSLSKMTPLYLILSKYHISRRSQTCMVIRNLMSAGADPKIVNAGGEAPAHIVVQIQDIQMMRGKRVPPWRSRYFFFKMAQKIFTSVQLHYFIIDLQGVN